MEQNDLSNKLERYQQLKRQQQDDSSLCITVMDAYLDGTQDSLTEESKQKFREAVKNSKELDALKNQLSWLLQSGNPAVISNPTSHRIAHELMKEITAECVDEDGAIDDWYYKVMDVLDIDPNQAAQNLASIKPLFLLYQPSFNVSSMAQEAVRAFCLDLHTATVAIARTLVETAVVDIAVKIGRISDPKVIQSMRMCERISSLIDRSVTKGSPLRQKIDRFMESASEIVHGNQAAGYQAARYHLEQAFELIKELYGQYKADYLHNSSKKITQLCP